MHKALADRLVGQVRKRISEGDCPITESLSTENLEDLVEHLADENDRLRGDLKPST